MYIERTNMASVTSTLHRTFVLCLISCVILGVRCTEESAGQTVNGTEAVTKDSTTVVDERTSIEKGMEVLFDMTHTFLDIVESGGLISQPWLNLTQIIKTGNIDGLTDWKKWLNYGKGYAACAIAGFLFMWIMPIFGCFFCCCRMCGACGGKRQKMDPPHAKCKRTTYCSILLVFNTVMLAGVVCAFVSNDLIHSRLQNENNRGPVGKLSSAVGGIGTFIDDVVKDVANTTLSEFDKTRNDLVRKINDSANDAVDKVALSLNATLLLNQAEDLAKDANDTKKKLDSVENSLDILAEMGTNLTKELNEIKKSIENDCNTTTICNINTSDYKTEADFTQLSNMTDVIKKVRNTLSMSKFVEQAKGKIDEIRENATTTVKAQIKDASSTLDNLRDTIKNKTDDFKSTIKSQTTFVKDFQNALNTTNPKIQKYSNYAYYGGIGLCCVYLLIAVLYYMGVLYGMCGERPGHDAPCCNKGMASNFLMSGVGFSFLFSWLLMWIIIILFFVGAPIYIEICRYFVDHNLNSLQPINSLVNELNLQKSLFNGKDVDISIINVLGECKNNSPIYQTFKLENMFNISSMINISSVDDKFDSIANTNVSIGSITLLSDELRINLQNFSESGLDTINFTSYREQINKKLVAGDLTLMAETLDNKSVEVNKTNSTIANNLKEYANRLRNLEAVNVKNMTDEVKSLNNSLNTLSKFSDIKNKTTDLLDSLTATETTFNVNGSTLVTEELKRLAIDLKNKTKLRIKDVINYIKDDAGKCRPLYDAFYGITDSVCVTMLNPVNGFWFSMGWCIFFFIPNIIFALLLTGLYRREEEYEEEKQFDDPNFSTYGGPHPDTIPLTRVNQQGHGPNPGVANSGYHREDHYDPRNSAHNNGYPNARPDYQGSKGPIPPAYGGGQQVYPSDLDVQGKAPKYYNY